MVLNNIFRNEGYLFKNTHFSILYSNQFTVYDRNVNISLKKTVNLYLYPFNIPFFCNIFSYMKITSAHSVY